jgi:hypothetical protein
MKIYINKYRNHWLSPYTILEKVCFWEKDKDVIYNLKDNPKNKYQKWVDRLEPVCVGFQKFLDIVHPKIDYVKIDYWDIWNMDSTLAPIILPMLKQLKEHKHGSGIVDLEDVPEYLRCDSTEEWDDQKCFDFYREHEVKEGDRDIHARWNWVLDEMIWAFEQLCDYDNDKEFYHGEKFDVKGYEKHHNRINNGTRLFGKYYRNLWD